MWPFLLEGSAATPPPPSTFPRAVTGISVQAPLLRMGTRQIVPTKHQLRPQVGCMLKARRAVEWQLSLPTAALPLPPTFPASSPILPCIAGSDFPGPFVCLANCKDTTGSPRFTHSFCDSLGRDAVGGIQSVPRTNLCPEVQKAPRGPFCRFRN